MNLSELLTQITDLQKDSEMLDEIVKLVGGKKEDVVVNLTDNNPINRAKILEEISDIRHLVRIVEEEYDSTYDEISNAIGNLKYVSSELDTACDVRNRLDDLEDMVKQDEEEEEEPVKKTPAKKMTTPFSDDDKNSLIDVISDGNSQQ